MCSILTASVSVLQLILPVAVSDVDAVRWSILHEQIHVGGCVEVIIEGPSQLAKHCELSVGGSRPMRFADRLCSTFSVRGRTVVLISHDVTRGSPIGTAPDRPSVFWIPPVFDKPGVIVLTMYVDGRSIGSKQIDVIPSTEGMQEAIDLLFPAMRRDVSLPEGEDAFRWLRVVFDRVFGAPTGITPEQLQLLRNELPIINQHPDWAEIAEMLVARLEARAHSRGLIELKDGAVTGLKASIDELPPWPEIVTRCLESTPQSPFAKAIQQDLWYSVKGIRILDAERRGEDIIPIVKMTGPPHSKKPRGDD